MSEFPADRELVLTRFIDAPRAAVWRCWTEPQLLKQWFAPKPYLTVDANIDPRAGGENQVTMQSPDGALMPSAGVYLEVIEHTKLVFTDAFSSDWRPRDGSPFMLAIVAFADEGDGTRYTARARHWTVEAARQHEQMGFHQGWGICADQLESLAQRLARK